MLLNLLNMKAKELKVEDRFLLQMFFQVIVSKD